MSDTRTIALAATTIHTTTLAGVSLVAVAGEIDLLSGGPLRAILAARLDQRPPNLVVDLTEVGFFSAAGVHALVATAAQARALGIAMVVVAAHRTVLRPLRITGVDRELHLRPTVEVALSALAEHAVPPCRSGCSPQAV